MRRQEEEELTMYGERDLTDDWEFKILRSATAAFRNPEKLQEILADEAHAGWILVEKFDDQRIRLKRPASARQLDGKLDFDPYRTTIGTTDGQRAAIRSRPSSSAFLVGLFLIALPRQADDCTPELDPASLSPKSSQQVHAPCSAPPAACFF